MKIRGLVGTKYVEGGLCAPKEFRMASNADFAILYCEWECVSAYIATENIFKSESIKLCLKRPERFRTHAILMSNLSPDVMNWEDQKIVKHRMGVFAKGLQIDMRRMFGVSIADLTAPIKSFDEEEVYAMTKDLRWRVADNAMNLQGGEQYTVALQFFLGNDFPCVIAGTMFWGAEAFNRKRIVVLSTDVAIDQKHLKKALEKEYRDTVLLLGGEAGVNDCACILSNGKVRNMKIDRVDVEYEKFARALKFVLNELCKRAVCGEDESKLIGYCVRGLESSRVARDMLKRLTDRFWKRGIVFSTLATDVLYAIGGIETEAELDKLSITFTSSKGKLLLYDDGRLMPNQMDRVHEVFSGNDRCLTVDFDSGNFRAQSWGEFLWESD